MIILFFEADMNKKTHWRELLSKNNAFTLFEVLVVLILLSMITGIIFEGLSYTLRVRRGLLVQIHRQRIGMLQSFWLRSVLSGTMPVDLPRKGKFSGRQNKISGVSAGTLGGIPGSPGTYTLTLLHKEQDTLVLMYSDQYGSRFPLGTWQNAEGVFMFIDDFKKFKQWPPKSVIRQFAQLPEAITLQITQPHHVQYWAAGISGLRDPLKNTGLQQGI